MCLLCINFNPISWFYFWFQNQIYLRAAIHQLQFLFNVWATSGSSYTRIKILFDFLPDFIEFTFGIQFCAMLQIFNPLIPFPGIPNFELLNPMQLLLWSYCRYMGIRRNMFVLISIVPSLSALKNIAVVGFVSHHSFNKRACSESIFLHSKNSPFSNVLNLWHNSSSLFL